MHVFNLKETEGKLCSSRPAACPSCDAPSPPMCVAPGAPGRSNREKELVGGPRAKSTGGKRKGPKIFSILLHFLTP